MGPGVSANLVAAGVVDQVLAMIGAATDPPHPLGLDGILSVACADPFVCVGFQITGSDEDTAWGLER